MLMLDFACMLLHITTFSNVIQSDNRYDAINIIKKPIKVKNCEVI